MSMQLYADVNATARENSAYSMCRCANVRKCTQFWCEREFKRKYFNQNTKLQTGTFEKIFCRTKTFF